MGVCSSEVVDQDEADLAREQEEAAAEAASQQRDDMEAAAETMLLKITEPAPGTTVEIRVSATVSDLKRKLGASYGIDRESAAHLKILFVGEVLSEETRLDQTALCQVQHSFRPRRLSGAGMTGSRDQGGRCLGGCDCRCSIGNHWPSFLYLLARALLDPSLINGCSCHRAHSPDPEFDYFRAGQSELLLIV